MKNLYHKKIVVYTINELEAELAAATNAQAQIDLFVSPLLGAQTHGYGRRFLGLLHLPVTVAARRRPRTATNWSLARGPTWAQTR